MKTLVVMFVRPLKKGAVRFDDRSTFNTAAYCGHSAGFGASDADVLLCGNQQAAALLMEQRHNAANFLRADEEQGRVRVLLAPSSHKAQFTLKQLGIWLRTQPEYDIIHLVGTHGQFLALADSFRKQKTVLRISWDQASDVPFWRSWQWRLSNAVAKWRHARSKSISSG